MRIKNQKEFWAGMMFAAFGIFFAGFGTQYTFGTAANTGPGYFPTVLGVITTVLGIVIAIGGLSRKAKEEKVQSFSFSTLLLILGPVVLFGVLLKPLGLVLSLFLLISISCFASHEFNWKVTLVVAAALIALSLLVFVWALSLQFQLWPSFVGN